MKKFLRKKQESTGILRNPGQERKTKNRDLEMIFLKQENATEAMASHRAGPIMGCGGRMPSTQHIAVTLTSWAGAGHTSTTAGANSR